MSRIVLYDNETDRRTCNHCYKKIYDKKMIGIFTSQRFMMFHVKCVMERMFDLLTNDE